MKKSHFHFAALLILVSVFWFVSLVNGGLTISSGTPDGLEHWGYVEVRPKAHLFWWYYKSPYRTQHPNQPWPVILWLQGGPGSSGVGTGNFQEVGPLDTFLKPRDSTWLKKADLLFVDNPVGTGYSYVEDESLHVKTDNENAEDLVTLLKSLFNEDEDLQKSPLYVVAESYGGKFAVTLGLSALKAIESKTLKLILGGIALGDTWISGEDFVSSWGPLLKYVSRIDNSALIESNRLVKRIKQEIADGRWANATDSWGEIESVIHYGSGGADFYNFLLDWDLDPLGTVSTALARGLSMKSQARYLNSLRAADGEEGNVTTLMNGAIRKKLGIIPDNVQWVESANLVFVHMYEEFMKPRINEVDELLNKGVNLTIYNGQVDLICSAIGTEAWVEKLKWDGLETFLSMDRTSLYCGEEKGTKGFYKSYKNLQFYWILDAGHFVPVDQPCLALDMIGNITHSPASNNVNVQDQMGSRGRNIHNKQTYIKEVVQRRRV